MEGEPVDAKALIELVKETTSGSESILLTSLAAVVGAVLIAHRFGLFSFLFNRTTVQAESFQGQMLTALQASHAREDALWAKLEAAGKLNDEAREELHRSRYDVHMLRQQLRLFILGWRQAKAGAIPIDAVPVPDMPGEPT